MRIVLAGLMMMGAVAWGADAPSITLKSPAAKVAPPIAPPKPEEPILEVGKFHWYGLDNYTGPVTWEIEGDAAKLFEMKTAAKVVSWEDAAGDPKFDDIPATAIIVRGLKVGRVKVSAWGVVESRAKRLATLTIDVGARAPPPKDPPIEKPVSGLYLSLIRPDGPVSNDFKNVMGLPAWGELKKAGIEFKDFTISEAINLGISLPAGTSLPCVLPLAISADRTSSRVIPPPLAWPRDNAAVQKLGEIKP